MKFKLMFVITLFIFGCKPKPTVQIRNDNLKYFISMDSYFELQKSRCEKNDAPPGSEWCEIAFDTLSKFSQVDSLKSRICKSDKFSSGSIALKYKYKSKFVFLEAFPYSCGSMSVDIFLHLIFINCFENSSFCELNERSLHLKDSGLRDSLIQKFSDSFHPFFEMYAKIMSCETDSISQRERKLRSLPYGAAFGIIMNLQNDSELQKIGEPIDFMLDTFEIALEKSLSKYYKKHLSELTDDELLIISRHLFLRFEIKPPIIKKHLKITYFSQLVFSNNEVIRIENAEISFFANQCPR